MSTWKTLESFNQDLMLFSEISEHEDVECEPPPDTILQYEARMGANNASIFDSPVSHEDVTYVSSGRGRGGVSKFFKPGIPVKERDMREDEQNVYRKIRQVSGLGYSNELIEKSFRKVTPLPIEEEFCDVSDKEDTKPQFTFSKTSENIKRNTKNTPSKSPKSMLSSAGSTSSLSSVTSSPVDDIVGGHSGDRSSRSSVNPSPVNANPLPLSVIMSMGKKKVPSKESSVRRESPKITPKESPVRRESPKITKVNLNTDTVCLKPEEKENSEPEEDNPHSNNENKHRKEYTLNPEAPEFKFSGFASPESVQHILVTKPPSINFGDISVTNSNLSNRNGFRKDLNSSDSSEEELSWRKRPQNINEISPGRNGNWRESSRIETNWSSFNRNKNRSTNDAPLAWRIPDNKFDITSDDDFPAL